MFKKLFLGIFALAAIIFVSGCGDKILINGKYYTILSPEEELAMIEFARLTLTSKSNQLPAAACNFIKSTQPKHTLVYSGNRSGFATYEWIFGDMYSYKITCRGKFLTDDMDVNVVTQLLIDDIDEKGEKRGNVTFQPFQEL